MKNGQIFGCPSAGQGLWNPMDVMGTWLACGFNCGYLGFQSQALVQDAAGTMMVADSNGDNRIGPDVANRLAGCGHCLVARHNEMLNIAFADGHGKAMKLSTIEANEAAWFNPAVF